LLLKAKIKMNISDADIIAKALKPDDLEWAKSSFETVERKGNKIKVLIIEVKTKKIGAMINAVDDFLINIKTALSVLNAVEQFSKPSR